MKISQREARRLLKRVQELETDLRAQRNAYAAEWPNGVHIGTITWNNDDSRAVAAKTARRLGHAVVVNATDNEIRLYAFRMQK